MQKTDLTHAQSDEESPRSGSIFRRYFLLWLVLVALLLLAIVPPLITVNHLTTCSAVSPPTSAHIPPRQERESAIH